ncbi:MAG: Uma2 family endonuclease [Planctomycetota bacterium]
MATSVASSIETRTLADLLEKLGGIPAARVRMSPLPGTATKEDVDEIECHEDRLCELVDGVLVEKPMGYEESFLACILIRLLGDFVSSRNLGIVTGEAGMMELSPGLVVIPDVAFISWSRLPGGEFPKVPVPRLAPDLAVEVLSLSNTAKEMARKRREYFQAGVRLVWEVDPVARTVTVYTAVQRYKVLSAAETLRGEPVLPGFELPLRKLFAVPSSGANA